MRTSLRQQKGLTMIELMISSVIGLIITYFMLNIIVSGTKTSIRSEGIANAQEISSFTILWLSNQIRRAGHLTHDQMKQGYDMSPFPDLCPVSPPAPGDAGGNCIEDNDDGPDRFAISRMYDIESNNSRDQEDCAGRNLAAAGIVDGTELTDVYWVEANSPNSDESDADDDLFYCATYNQETGTLINDIQVLASGVENIQFLFGVADTLAVDSTTGISVPKFNVNRFVRAANLPVTDIGETDWEKVQAVRFAVLTRSHDSQAMAEQKRYYILLNADPMEFEDSVARHITTTTTRLMSVPLSDE